jgi:imidazolonepropionase-like amidohydrolase
MMAGAICWRKREDVKMKRLFAFALLALLLMGTAGNLAAQDLVITNARIIVGNGTVIPQGSIVIRGGKLASVAAGAPANAPAGAQTINAQGMTAMPGFIDGHRHVNTGPNEKVQMQQLVDAGYTTVLSGGGPAEGNITLRDHIDSGMIKGPRIIPTGSVNIRMTPEKAREDVRKLAQLGVKWSGEISVTPKPNATAQEIENLKAAVDEGKKVGVRIQVHAVSPQAMAAATLDAGVRYLVHTPHFGWQNMEDSKKMAQLGVKQLSTIGFGVPVFAVEGDPKFPDDNTPRFRDGNAWPDKILDGDGRAQEAGYKPVNARTSWDAGIVYGYGTDTGYLAWAGLEHELKTLNLMFSMRDIIKLMGPNSASYLEMSDQLGTLEAGKLADIVLLGGNPLDGFWNMLNAKVTIVGGKIMSDQRQK